MLATRVSRFSEKLLAHAVRLNDLRLQGLADTAGQSTLTCARRTHEQNQNGASHRSRSVPPTSLSLSVPETSLSLWQRAGVRASDS